MTYKEQFKDPRWQKKRLEILQRDDFACRFCYDSEKTLNVHHLYYVSHREPWCYPNGALVTLCDECHKLEHEAEKRIDSTIDNASEMFDRIGHFESIDSVIDSLAIFSLCAIPPDINRLGSALLKYATRDCSIDDLITFLKEKYNGKTTA